MIKKVTMYEASDGTLLPDYDAAQIYNDMLDLFAYIDKNMIEPYAGSHVAEHITGAALKLWLKDNPRIYLRLLPEDAKEEDLEDRL